MLTLLGSYLIGHVLIGHTITADLWQLLVGAVLTIVGSVTEMISTNTTPTQVQSAIGTIVTAIGGVLLALGVVNQQTWADIVGVITAIVPLFQKQTTKLAIMHVVSGKATADPKTGSIMKAVKKASIIIFLIGFASVAHAQSGCGILDPGDSVKYSQVWNWSMPELKEAAKTCYFKVMDMINQRIPFTKEGFDTALNQYEYWQKVVDLKLTTKKDRDEFHNWIVAEARKEGKLNHPEGEIN
jgi:hypothetical protein